MAKFYGVGVGPGDPELLTLKAKRILEEVDVVCVPLSKKEKDSVAYQIAKPHLRKNTSLMELLMPMSTDLSVLQKHWQLAAEQIAAFIKQGKDTAFITIGDPLMYSTFGYLLKSVLQIMPEAEIETIPGITSFCAAAARTNTVLTEGNETLKIIPLPMDNKKLAANLQQEDNLVFLKVSAQLEEILDSLSGCPEKSAIYISRCGQSEEKVLHNPEELKGTKADYLSLMLVKSQSTK